MTEETTQELVAAPQTPKKRQAENKLVMRDVDRKVRAEAALTYRALGRSYREIGRLLDITEAGVRKMVKKAQQDEQLLRSKGVVGERLVPKALAVYDQQLDAGNLEAARDILFGVGILTKNATMKVEGAADPLERFRQRYFEEKPEVIEAEVTADATK